MSAKRDRGHVDEAFTLAAWDQAKSMERIHDARIQVSLSLDKRRGVWHLNGRLLSHVDGRPVGIQVQNRRQYPSVTVAGLAAALFGLLVDLDNAHDLPMLREQEPQT